MSWVLDQKEVHMTIGSSIRHRASDQGFTPDLTSDVQMVKAALLYADHAKLVSVGSFALLDMFTPHDVTNRDPLVFLRNRVLWTRSDETKKQLEETIERYEWAKRRRHSKRGREELKRMNEWFAEYLETVQAQAAVKVSEFGADGVFDAVDSGLLDIHTFESLFDRVTQASFSVETLHVDYVTAVSHAIGDTQTYPLFDEATGDIITSGIERGNITVPKTEISRSKEVALAADLLARLPLFERATVKEILDIRRELQKPLRNFRSAMIKFSNRIESASWDKNFAQDADQVFRSEVAPAVMALEDQEKSSSFLNKLTAKVAEKSIQVGGAVSASAAISALAVRMLNLPLADVAALAAGPAIAAGGVAYSAYKEWREQQQVTEGNSLFFYYKAGELLQNRSFEYENS